MAAIAQAAQPTRVHVLPLSRRTFTAPDHPHYVTGHGDGDSFQATVIITARPRRGRIFRRLALVLERNVSGFFVGQRVRIKWSVTWPGLTGKPGRIIARLSEAHRQYLPPGHTGEWEVAPDDWGGSASPDALGFFIPASEQLEPMLPDGMRAAAWEECEWQPEGLPEEVLAS